MHVGSCIQVSTHLWIDLLEMHIGLCNVSTSPAMCFVSAHGPTGRWLPDLGPEQRGDFNHIITILCFASRTGKCLTTLEEYGSPLSGSAPDIE